MKETIKNLREFFRYSQTQIAAMVGVSRQMYIKYENGEYEPNVKVISALCRVYNVPYQIIIENKYKDGVPERRDASDFMEKVELNKTVRPEAEFDFSHLDDNGMEVAEPVAGYESKPTSSKTEKIFQQIYALVEQLGIEDRMKVIAHIADSVREELQKGRN